MLFVSWMPFNESVWAFVFGTIIYLRPATIAIDWGEFVNSVCDLFCPGVCDVAVAVAALPLKSSFDFRCISKLLAFDLFGVVKCVVFLNERSFCLSNKLIFPLLAFDTDSLAACAACAFCAASFFSFMQCYFVRIWYFLFWEN